jgi:hypothetical protein
MWEFILKYWVEFLFGIIAAGLVAGYKKLANRIQSDKETEKAIADGMRCLLMYQLREEGEKHITAGSCTIDDKREFERAYNAYHMLGGNGTITSLKDQVIALPLK